MIAEIKQLLYDEKLTINGARTKLAQRKGRPKATTDANVGQPGNLKQALADVVVLLQELKNML